MLGPPLQLHIPQVSHVTAASAKLDFAMLGVGAVTFRGLVLLAEILVLSACSEFTRLYLWSSFSQLLSD